MIFGVALRQRLRDWRTSAAFITVIGVAVTVAGTWLAVAYPLLKRALPFPNADRLVAIETLKSNGDRGGLSWMDLVDLRGGGIESIAGFLPRTWGLQTENHGHVEVVLSQQVTGEFFKVLGVDVALGTPLTPKHEHAGNQAYAWFSHAAWQRFLGSETTLANKVVWLNAVPYRVAGVVPQSFDFPTQGQSPDIYIPLNRVDYWNSRGGGALGVIARLKPGIGIERFRSELAVHATSLPRFSATDITGYLLGDRLTLLRWLMLAVSLLLLVAMANSSGIWLAQWLRQQRRVAIQLFLGASQWRVWQEQLAQVLLLGVAASLVGLLGVAFLLNALRASSLFDPELSHFELWRKATLDVPSSALLISLTLLTSLVSGLLPILGERRPTSRSSRRLRIVLAAAQLTVTGTLAYAGIMIARNVHTLLLADRGFRTEQLLVSGIGISEAKYNTDEKMIGFHQQAIAELKHVPGVIDAAGGMSLPVSQARTRFLVDGESTSLDQQRMTRIGIASPELLPLLGIPCIRGRLFSSTDLWTSPKVALVNRAFVDRYLAGDPLNHRLRIAFYNGFAAKPYAEHQIIGVFGNTLNRDLAAETEPQIVISSDQIAMEGFRYFIRSSLPAAALKKQVQEAIWKVDPEVQAVKLTPLIEQVEKSLVSRRLLVWLLNVFGGIAIMVVIFGLASTLSATFLEITRELGIRSALGAPKVALALESVRWALLAIVISEMLTATISIALGRFIVLDRAPMGWDPASWIAASIVLALIGVAAALLPARKAASIDPAVTLRCE